jgi:hypothetical protein
MNSRFPLRPESHRLEKQSQRFFEKCLPKNWTCDKVPTDYGVDLHVEMFEGDNATGYESSFS